MCEMKERWAQKDERHARMAFMAFSKFHEITSYSKVAQTYDYFMRSRVYGDFIKFGKHLVDIQAVDPAGFTEFLVRASVPISKWTEEFVYEQFIRELCKRESPDKAVERNILLFQQWEQDSGKPWYDFFREVGPIEATRYIKAGRLSPWVMYFAPSASEMFDKMSDEQLKMVKTFIDPNFWSRKFDQKADDVAFVKSILDQSGL